MSTRMTGRLAADKGGTLMGLGGYRISVRLPGSLFDYNGQRLGDVIVTKADGTFEIGYTRDLSPVGFRRQLELVVQDPVGRVVPFPTPSGRLLVDDIPDEHFSKGDVIVREADATGLLATLGTGTVSRLSTDNKVTLLMDHDAFAYVAAMIASAEKEIQMSQLFFGLPAEFHADATQDVTKLVFDFHSEAGLDLAHPRAAGVGDARPERLLIEAARRGVDTRILLNAPTIPFFIKMMVGLLLFPFFGFGGFFLARDKLGPELADVDEAKRYFGGAGTSNIKVRPFEQSMLSHGVMHAKLMIVDGLHALSIGSPFSQSYVDSHGHRIDAWIRGGSESYPMHDAGFIASGPALRDIYATMKLLWDETGADDKLPDVPTTTAELPREPSLLARPADGTCAMQIVRTLSSGRFTDDDPGEKGILEAYQRAFAEAGDFIYLETQYFTNDAIGDALVEAMTARPQLQVIVLLNIEPDVMTYPFKQRRLITRIRKAIGQKPNEGPQRFGAFTRWTHEPGETIPTGKLRPRMLPVYIHAKVGIVDNTWATVGSANLDGLSLDSSLPSDILHNLFNMREQRAIEVNAVMLNRPGQPSEVVDILRRKLWAEHLGYMNDSDVLDIAAPDLQRANRPTGGWLSFWSARAKALLQKLKDTPSEKTTGMARVLPWPEDNSTYSMPRVHLTALGIRSHAVIPLKSTRAFDFETGDWKKGSKAKMDYD